jgi:hypothetical protein
MVATAVVIISAKVVGIVAITVAITIVMTIDVTKTATTQIPKVIAIKTVTQIATQFVTNLRLHLEIIRLVTHYFLPPFVRHLLLARHPHLVRHHLTSSVLNLFLLHLFAHRLLAQ